MPRMTKAKRSAAAKKAAATRRRNAMKTTPTRRRRVTRKKKGMLSDLITPAQAENGFKQLVGIGVGFYAGEMLTPVINPDGESANKETAIKLAGGFAIATMGKMPNVGAGMIASGFKTLLANHPTLGLGDRSMRTNYLNDAPMVVPTEMYLDDYGYLDDAGYLNDYTAAYQSETY